MALTDPSIRKTPSDVLGRHGTDWRRRRSTNDTSLTLTNKAYQLLHRRDLSRHGINAGQSLLKTVTTPEELAIRLLEATHILGCERTSFKAFDIDTSGHSSLPRGNNEWRDIPVDMGTEGQQCAFSHTAELMHQRIATEDNVIGYLDVTRDGSIVGEDRVIADKAIMGDMTVGHDPVAMADTRDTATLASTSINRHELADGIAVAYLQLRVLTAELLILSHLAYRGELKDAIVTPETRRSVQHHVWPDPACRPNLDIRTHYRERPDLDIVRDPGPIADDRAWVNHEERSLIVHRISADPATSPSTRASPSNIQMPRTVRVSATDNQSCSPGSTGRLNLARSTPTR